MKDALPSWTRAAALVAAGALAASAVPSLLTDLTGDAVPLMWWLARALGLVAYLTLFLATLFGLLVRGRGLGLLAPAWAIDLHRTFSLSAVTVTAAHVLCVLADPASGVAAAVLLWPWASAVRTGPVALGTFAVWGLALVIGTTAAGRNLSHAWWRAVHAGAYGALLLACLHGITAGSDTGALAVRALYLGTAVVLVAALSASLAGPPGAAERRRNQNKTAGAQK